MANKKAEAKKQGKGKAKDTSKAETKFKAKGKDKTKVKAKSEGKTKGKDKTKAKRKVKGKDKAKLKPKAKPKAKSERKTKKGKDKTKAKPKAKGKDKAKLKPKAKPKAKSERKAKNGKAKTKAKQETEPKPKIKAKAKKKAKARAETRFREEIVEPLVLVAPNTVQQRWMRVATNLGLGKHLIAVSAWDGQGNPPILPGFTFVRHVDSDARDLKCTGTSVTMTTGVIVKREDGKLFLTGRGVAQKYLGIQVPPKDRANAGKRYLTAQEREDLGQPPARTPQDAPGG